MSLQQSVTRGIKWTSVSTIVAVGSQFAQGLILARLLSPDDFGLYGMILPVFVFAQGFADMGISNAIIYRQDTTQKQLSSLYWLTVVSGITIAAILLIIAPFIADFYGESRLIGLISLLALSYPITSLGQQFQILLQKQLSFDVLSKIEITSSLLGVISSILFALRGYGATAFAIAILIRTFVASLIFMIHGWKTWRPALRFRVSDLRGYVSFGLYQMSARSLNYLASNTDYVFIGYFLGSEPLGLYTMAYQLTILPYQKINPILTKVAFPVFAMEQRNNSVLRDGYLEVLRWIGFIVFPLVIGIGITAETSVPLLIGPEWTQAVPIIRVLALVGLLKAIGNPSGWMFLAKGRADINFGITIFALSFNAGVFWIAAHTSVVAVAWAYVFSSFINLAIIFLILYWLIRLKARQVVLALRSAIVASVLLVIAKYALNYLLESINMYEILTLMLYIVLGGIVYCLALYKQETALFQRVLGDLVKRKTSSSQLDR